MKCVRILLNIIFKIDSERADQLHGQTSDSKYWVFEINYEFIVSYTCIPGQSRLKLDAVNLKEINTYTYRVESVINHYLRWRAVV